MNALDEHLRFELPEGVVYLTQTEENGSVTRTINTGKHLDLKSGKEVFETRVSVGKFEDLTNLFVQDEEGVHRLQGSHDNRWLILDQQMNMMFWNVTVHIATLHIRTPHAVYTLTANKAGDAVNVLPVIAKMLNDAVSYMVIDGERVVLEPLTASMLLKALHDHDEDE